MLWSAAAPGPTCVGNRPCGHFPTPRTTARVGYRPCGHFPTPRTTARVGYRPSGHFPACALALGRPGGGDAVVRCRCRADVRGESALRSLSRTAYDRPSGLLALGSLPYAAYDRPGGLSAVRSLPCVRAGFRAAWRRRCCGPLPLTGRRAWGIGPAVTFPHRVRPPGWVSGPAVTFPHRVRPPGWVGGCAVTFLRGGRTGSGGGASGSRPGACTPHLTARPSAGQRGTRVRNRPCGHFPAPRTTARVGYRLCGPFPAPRAVSRTGPTRTRASGRRHCPSERPARRAGRVARCARGPRPPPRRLLPRWTAGAR